MSARLVTTFLVFSSLVMAIVATGVNKWFSLFGSGIGANLSCDDDDDEDTVGSCSTYKFILPAAVITIVWLAAAVCVGAFFSYKGCAVRHQPRRMLAIVQTCFLFVATVFSAGALGSANSVKGSIETDFDGGTSLGASAKMFAAVVAVTMTAFIVELVLVFTAPARPTTYATLVAAAPYPDAGARAPMVAGSGPAPATYGSTSYAPPAHSAREV